MSDDEQDGVTGNQYRWFEQSSVPMDHNQRRRGSTLLITIGDKTVRTKPLEMTSWVPVLSEQDEGDDE